MPVDLREKVSRRLLSDLPPAEREFVERVFATPAGRYEQALRAAGMAGRDLVIDLGAGYGQWSQCLARLNRRVIAVEPQPGRIGFLRDLSGGAFDVRQGTAEAIPVDDGAADGLWCFGVLQYVDTCACFSEIARVLRPGGAAYVLGKDLGGYLFDWVERRNRTDGYDPRRVAADAFANTLQLEESGTIHPASAWTDRIVPRAAAEAAAVATCLRVVHAGPEGSAAERSGARLEYPAHFFGREYRGIPFSYELLLERTEP